MPTFHASRTVRRHAQTCDQQAPCSGLDGGCTALYAIVRASVKGGACAASAWVRAGAATNERPRVDFLLGTSRNPSRQRVPSGPQTSARYSPCSPRAPSAGLGAGFKSQFCPPAALGQFKLSSSSTPPTPSSCFERLSDGRAETQTRLHLLQPSHSSCWRC